MRRSFKEEVLEQTKKIPKGRVVTYQELARAVGRGRAFRAVGNVLHNNKNQVTIPCHRVVCSTGMLGGYNKGKRNKKKLLISEGIVFKREKIDLKVFEWKSKNPHI